MLARSETSQRGGLSSSFLYRIDNKRNHHHISQSLVHIANIVAAWFTLILPKFNFMIICLPSASRLVDETSMWVCQRIGCETNLMVYHHVRVHTVIWGHRPFANKRICWLDPVVSKHAYIYIYMYIYMYIHITYRLVDKIHLESWLTLV